VSQDERNESSIFGIATYVFLAIAFVYFGLFGLIILDELVFKTFIINNNMPMREVVEDFLKTIYWPLIKLMDLVV